MDPSLGQCVLNAEEGPPKAFTFDGVYYMDATAEQIYNDIVYPLVEVSVAEEGLVYVKQLLRMSSRDITEPCSPTVRQGPERRTQCRATRVSQHNEGMLELRMYAAITPWRLA